MPNTTLIPTSADLNQRRRFLEAIRLIAIHAPHLADIDRDVAEDETDHDALGEEASICDWDNTWHGYKVVTLSSLERFLVLTQLHGATWSACVAQTVSCQSALTQVIGEAVGRHCHGDRVRLVLDLDAERKLKYTATVQVEVTWTRGSFTSV